MEIIREYDWNGKHYIVVEQGGKRVELKCSHDDVPAVFAKLNIADEPEPPQVASVLDLSDTNLLAEVKRRGLSVVAVGSAI